MDPGGAEGADEFLARLRADEAIAARRRERWRRQQLSERATLAGALAAAVGDTVKVDLVNGERWSGTVDRVGRSVLGLSTAGGTVWVAMDAVVAVGVDRPLPAAGPVPAGPVMGEVLQELVEVPVRLGLIGGGEVSGSVQAVGAVVTLRDDGGAVSYASVDAVVRVARPG